MFRLAFSLQTDDGHRTTPPRVTADLRVDRRTVEHGWETVASRQGVACDYADAHRLAGALLDAMPHVSEHDRVVVTALLDDRFAQMRVMIDDRVDRGLDAINRLRDTGRAYRSE